MKLETVMWVGFILRKSTGRELPCYKMQCTSHRHDRHKSLDSDEGTSYILFHTFSTEDPHYNDSIYYQRFCCKIEFAVIKKLDMTHLKHE